MPTKTKRASKPLKPKKASRPPRATRRAAKRDDREPEVLGADGDQVDTTTARVSPGVDAGEGIDVPLGETGTATADDARQQTLGEIVNAQRTKPQRITWPHDIGTSVMLRTPGYPDAKAIIRNIHDHGGYTLYDLNIGEGTCDGVPADRIGRDLDAEGELEGARLHIAALERHIAAGAVFSKQISTMEETETRLARELSEHRKAMEEKRSQLAAHARCQPGQQDLRDLPEVGGRTTDNPKPRQARKEAKPSAAEDKLADGAARAQEPAAAAQSLHDRIAGGEALDPVEAKLTPEHLVAAAFNQDTASTGKPQKLSPVTIGGTEYVVGDVQDGVAVLLPLYSTKQWAQTQQDTYGLPKDVPTIGGAARLEMGGLLNGTPVRVGRSVRYVGAEPDAVLVRMPGPSSTPEPEKAVGKDAAAGAD